MGGRVWTFLCIALVSRVSGAFLPNPRPSLFFSRISFPFHPTALKQRLSMALKSEDLIRNKGEQECPLRSYRSKTENDGLSTATFALG